MNVSGLAATMLLAASIVLPATGAGGEAPSFMPIPVTDGVFVVQGPLELPNEHNRGFRNNAVIILTTAGVVLFDPGGSAWAGEQLAAVAATLSQAPIVAIFNSHAHGDHWLGNEGVRRHYPNVVIHGHPEMRSRVAGPDGVWWLRQIEDLTNGTADGDEVVPPDSTVVSGDEIVIGGMTFRVHHPGPAHTDHDIMIEIVEKRVLFTGDIVRNGMLGLMETGASFSGNIAAIDAMLAMPVEHYIPGHGAIGGRELALEYRNYLDTLLTTVRRLYHRELSDFEMKPAVSSALADFDDWEGFDIRLGAHISRAYIEIEAEEF